MSKDDITVIDDRLSIDNAINERCPWSGDEIQPDSLTMYKGHVVGFCNSGCKDKFETAIQAFEQLID